MNVIWSPNSWKRKAVAQQVVYPDRAALEEVLAELAKLPPLVTSWEVERLKSQLAEATRGERFLLQGGDCAEKLRRLPLGVHRREAQDPAENELRAPLWL